jgi:hypothetical protein
MTEITKRNIFEHPQLAEILNAEMLVERAIAKLRHETEDNPKPVICDR